MEREMTQYFHVAADQAEKMGMADLQYAVNFYRNTCLVHVNMEPLVATFVHRSSAGSSPNFGGSLDMIPELRAALEPVRAQVKEWNEKESLGS
ncbi:unnamed protein product [Discosporangium mesarthrocarpum]